MPRIPPLDHGAAKVLDPMTTWHLWAEAVDSTRGVCRSALSMNRLDFRSASTSSKGVIELSWWCQILDVGVAALEGGLCSRFFG
jgi:hypothetical protein